jgi:hypothetical protein
LLRAGIKHDTNSTDKKDHQQDRWGSSSRVKPEFFIFLQKGRDVQDPEHLLEGFKVAFNELVADMSGRNESLDFAQY